MNTRNSADRAKPAGRQTEKWEALIHALYQSSGRSIVDFLPEIVRLIKKSNPSLAEKGLLSVFHSPIMRKYIPDFQLVTPALVTPAYSEMDQYADAVRFPKGEVRRMAKAVFAAFAADKALTPEAVMAMWEAMAKAKGVNLESDDASKKQASRKRARLGVSRRSGRPAKVDKSA